MDLLIIANCDKAFPTSSLRYFSCLVLSALDEVAWLYNLRGSDIKFNPVFFAYAAVTADEAHLFVSDKQVLSVFKHVSKRIRHILGFLSE